MCEWVFNTLLIIFIERMTRSSRKSTSFSQFLEFEEKTCIKLMFIESSSFKMSLRVLENLFTKLMILAQVASYRLLTKNRSSHRRCSVRKGFLEISQNSQGNTCARGSFLIKLQASGLQLYQERDWRRCFPVDFAKLLRKIFLQNTSGLLLLAKLTFFQESFKIDFPFHISEKPVTKLRKTLLQPLQR